jgi:hypothetical protein
MTPAHDPLHEPLRLLREARLPTGFEERLAERLAATQPRSNLVRLPGRKRILLLVAAIALPALAASAGAYYVQRRSSAASPATSTEKAPSQVDVKHHVPLPKAGLTVTVPPVQPATPIIEKLPAPRSQKSSRPSNAPSKAERRQPNGPVTEKAVSSPAANAVPRIEALDPFATQSISTKQPTATPKAADVSESLRKATEQGAARTRDDEAHSSRRDAHSNENRGNDAAQQARERVQARERKGQ